MRSIIKTGRLLKAILAVLCFTTNSLDGQQIKVHTITEEFDGSGGLNLGSDGMLYVANFGESLDNANGTQVWVIDYKNGGQPILFATNLTGASGNDFDSEGNLFQSNISAGTVSKIDPNGNTSFFATNGISCNVGINIDAEDNLYVCNCCGGNGNTIRKVTKNGVSTLFSSSNLFFCPNGITRDKENNLYVSNFSNGNVIKIDPLGNASLLATTPGLPGVSAPSNGHIIYSELENVLYVASHGSHRIYKLTLDGELTVLAGSGIRGNQDGSAMEASFSRPNGLALSDTEDTLFVNSSIPITDAGGRPLNPSVIRMITGLRGISSVKEQTHLDITVAYDPFSRMIRILDLPITSEALKVTILTMDGKVILNEELDALAEHELKVPQSVIGGLYFVRISTESGKFNSTSVFIP
ncbi:MAG: hypothetical protein AAGA77_10495 [Bacteroidota bacterium]